MTTTNGANAPDNADSQSIERTPDFTASKQCYCTCHGNSLNIHECKHCDPTTQTTKLENGTKLVIFGWITTILGLPKDGNPDKYNKLTDKLYDLVKPVQPVTPPERIEELKIIQHYSSEHYNEFNEDIDTDEYVEEITALIQSEASRIGLEAIGDGKSDSVHNYNAHVEREILRAEQRAKLKALTAPEGDTRG